MQRNSKYGPFVPSLPFNTKLGPPIPVHGLGQASRYMLTHADLYSKLLDALNRTKVLKIAFTIKQSHLTEIIKKYGNPLKRKKSTLFP